MVKSVEIFFEMFTPKSVANLQKIFKNKSVETFATLISVALL